MDTTPQNHTPRQHHAVTGAFGYTGRHIAALLLKNGHSVSTLTNSPHRPDPFHGRVPHAPFNFHDPEQLTRSLQGVDVLHNTYWVRFNHKRFTHAQAVRNTRTLFQAAKDAGVKRIIHISITNADPNSPLEYFQGKGLLEQDLANLGVPYTILRPAVLFGNQDILINNIAWGLRHCPIFPLFGYGSYKLTPIHVQDLAALAVQQAAQTNNTTIVAQGPETFTYRTLVQTIADAIGRTPLILSVPPWLAYYPGWIISKLRRDVFITKEEIQGLMANLLHEDTPPTAPTKLTTWLHKTRTTIGRHYANELQRRKSGLTTKNLPPQPPLRGGA